MNRRRLVIDRKASTEVSTAFSWLQAQIEVRSLSRAVLNAVQVSIPLRLHTQRGVSVATVARGRVSQRRQRLNGALAEALSICV